MSDRFGELPVWRLIPVLYAPGHVQMAIDRWLLNQHRLGCHPPTLRFYCWTPAAISLGYHQRQWPEFWQELTWKSKPIHLVRRPTGGRAVLHQGDLTYAVVTSGMAGDRTQAYQAICEFLIAGWRSLGVDLHYGQAGRGYIHNPNCFSTATAADLVLSNGTKLIGSAQLRSSGAILQHGSIRLEPDAELLRQVFGLQTVHLPSIPLQERGEALFQVVVKALVQAAQQCFGVSFVTQPLSKAEWEAILEQPEVSNQPTLR